MMQQTVRWGLPLGLAILIPVGTWIGLPRIQPLSNLTAEPSDASQFAESELGFRQQTIGDDSPLAPRVTSLELVDLDGDGANEIVACDAGLSRIVVLRRSGSQWNESVLATDIIAPLSSAFGDLDGDGDNDLVIGGAGRLVIADDPSGKVTWLRRDGDTWEQVELLDDVRTVVAVEVGDIDADGDIDVFVAASGSSRGRLLWLENRGAGAFVDHHIEHIAGIASAELGDLDADDDMDIVLAVSGENESVLVMENDGKGRFERRTLFETVNHDLGISAAVRVDLDGDGDDDFVIPAGGQAEFANPYPQPYHGCWLLDNRGDGTFEMRQLVEFGGVAAAAVSDLDGDGDQDIVLASRFNDWRDKQAASLAWLENDGSSNFQPWQIATSPIRLGAVVCDDLDADGRMEIVAAGLHVDPPFERMGRLTMWTRTEN